MFAGDSQMLRNKRHFVISVIVINVFFCILLPICNPHLYNSLNWLRTLILFHLDMIFYHMY